MDNPKQPLNPPAWWPFPATDPDTLQALIAADEQHKQDQQTKAFLPALL